MPTIISLWPEKRRERRNQYEPTHVYEIPAAPEGGFSRLKIVDQRQNQYMGNETFMKIVVPAREVAEDIAQSASKFKVGAHGHMGIYVHEIDDPTDEQILASSQHALAVQENEALMHGIVTDARQLFAQGQPLQPYHHMAAKHLRISGEKWQDRNVTRDATKTCQFCSAVLMSASVICGTCKEIVDQQGYDALKSAQRPAPAPDVPVVSAPVLSALTPAGKKQAGA